VCEWTGLPLTRCHVMVRGSITRVMVMIRVSVASIRGVGFGPFR